MLPKIFIRAEADVNDAVSGLDRLGDEYDRTAARSDKAGKRISDTNNRISKSAARSAEVISAEMDRLRSRYDPLFAASKRYESELNELNRAHRIGALTARQHEAALELLNAEYARSTTASAGVGQSARRMGGNLQNVAFQVGDFATQVGAGTSASIALGQQLPQLLGGFGALGAVMGAVVAIGVPLAASFIKAGDGARKLTKDLEDVRDATREASEELQVMIQGLGSVEELRIMQGIAEIEREIAATEDRIANTREEVARASQVQLKNLQEQRDELVQTLEEYRSIRAEQERLTANAQAYDDAMSQSLVPIGEAENLVQLMKDGVSAAAIQAMRLGDVDMASAIDDATVEAAELAATLGVALDAARALANQGVDPQSGKVYSGRGGDPREQGGSAFDWMNRAGTEFLENWEPPKKDSKSGRDRGAITASLVNDLATAREQLEIWRDEKMEILANANAQELEALGGHNEAKIRLEQEYQRRLKDIQSSEAQQRIATIQGWTGAVASILGSFGDMMDAENKKQFEKQKKIRTAAAIVEGIGAAVAAWRSGMEVGGLPLAAAYTIASVAKTAAQIAAIQRQSYNGGGSATAGGAGGIPSVGGGGAGGGQQAQRPAVNLTLIGDQGFSRAQITQIAEALNDASDDGTQSINIRGRR